MSKIINGQYQFTGIGASGLAASERTAEMETVCHMAIDGGISLLADTDHHTLLLVQTMDTSTLEVQEGKWNYLVLVEEATGFRLVRKSSGRTVREMVPPSSLYEATAGCSGIVAAEPQNWWTVRYGVVVYASGTWEGHGCYRYAIQGFSTRDRAEARAWKIAADGYRQMVGDSIEKHLSTPESVAVPFVLTVP